MLLLNHSNENQFRTIQHLVWRHVLGMERESVVASREDDRGDENG